MSKDSSTSSSVFRERLHALRQERGLRQAALARLAGVSPALICRMEDGSRRRTAGPVLERLSVALGTSTDYLLGLTDDPRPVIAIDSLSLMERQLIAEFRRLPSEPWQRAMVEEARRLRALQEEIASAQGEMHPKEEPDEPAQAA
ncbi:MAG: helix-turn-helix transcriptional regulator [Anaerolineae bacterium]|nr:helix-turn-helix transcriptional regulator [Anaerolineae bacterium]